MSLSFGRPALPCVLGGRAAITCFFVAEAGIGSMPFGGLVEVAIARSSRRADGTRETIRVAGPQTTKSGGRTTWDNRKLGESALVRE
jgi:hypothetical protein